MYFSWVLISNQLIVKWIVIFFFDNLLKISFLMLDEYEGNGLGWLELKMGFYLVYLCENFQCVVDI